MSEQEPGGSREEMETPMVDSLRSVACKSERIRRTLEEKQLEEARRGESVL